MSDTEFKDRVDIIIKSLEKTKSWYRAASLAFFIGFCVFLLASGVVTYRMNSFDEGLSKAASIRSVVLLIESIDANSEALISLVDSTHQDTAREFYSVTKILNSKILMCLTKINTRSAIVSIGGRNGGSE